MSSRFGLAALGIAAVVSGVATAAYTLGVYLPAFNTPHTPIEGIEHPRGSVPTTSGLARHLAIVVTDGLSYDAARTLEELAPLRRAGAFRAVIAEYPTYTSPALTSFVTGLGPRDSGVRLNGDASGTAGVDNLIDEALAAHVGVTVWPREFPLFTSLMRADHADVAPGRLRFIADFATRALTGLADAPLTGQTPTRAIDLVHVEETDHAGHYHGAASPEYAEAAHTAGAIAARVAASLDLRQDTIVVLSDHGHRPEGGHGGVEPGVSHAFLLIAGGFARSGVELAPAHMRDVASTLSVLAGVHIPTSNLGHPLLDSISLFDEEHSIVLTSPFEEASAFLCTLAPNDRCAEAPALVDRLRHGDPLAWPLAEQLLDDLGAARDRSLADRAREARSRRITFAAVFAAVGALALALTRKRWATGARIQDVLPALAFAAAFALSMANSGYSATFSAIRPASYFYKETSLAAALGFAAALLAGRLARTTALAAWIVLAAAVIPFALLAAWVGADPWVLPPPAEGVLVFEIGPSVVGAGVTALALALLARRLAKA